MTSVADPNQIGRMGRRAQANAESNTQTYPTPEVPNAEQSLKLDLPEKLPIESLLEYVGNYLHLDFMYDPAKVQGEVTLKLQGKLKGSIEIKDLYPLLESVLKFKGFVMTRKGNIVTVVPTMEAMDADPKLRTRSGPVDFGDAVLTRVFRLRHVDTASAEALLTQMKLGVAFSSIAETKTLIVTAFTATMPRIEALLDLVDQPGEPKQFRYRPLKYTMATTLTEKVKALAEQMGTIQVSVSTTAAQPALRQNAGESEAAFRQRQAREVAMRAATARAQTAPGAQATPETVYLDADERTNRILMVGRQEQLAIVDRLVDSLDVQQQDLRSLLLYRIEHVDAQDVRKKLEELNIVAAQYDLSDLVDTDHGCPANADADDSGPAHAAAHDPERRTDGREQHGPGCAAGRRGGGHQRLADQRHGRAAQANRRDPQVRGQRDPGFGHAIRDLPPREPGA